MSNKINLPLIIQPNNYSQVEKVKSYKRGQKVHDNSKLQDHNRGRAHVM